MKRPCLPLLPTHRPQQRIVPIADLADRPVPFDDVVGWREKPSGVDLSRGPRKAEYLGQIEWTWSPMNHRIDPYYISRGRTHWMLWVYLFDDDEGWYWLPIGHVPLGQATLDQAAVHLMVDYWRYEKDDIDLDHFHWIDEEGYFGSSDWRTIGLMVWPPEEENLELGEGEDE